jgi:hypothetical protein
MLLIGLVLSQLLPVAMGATYGHIQGVVTMMLGVCLAYIMINVGREFELDRSMSESMSKIML